MFDRYRFNLMIGKLVMLENEHYNIMYIYYL